jgi:Domain of unknown function (DUF4145)
MSMGEDGPYKLRVYCNWCKQETQHESKGEYFARWDDDDEPFYETLTFRLLICLGCEHAVLQEEYYTDAIPEQPSLSYFPERSRNELSSKPYSKLKPKLAAIYKEALICYNGKALILCAAGLRALLEGVCQDKRIKGRNLKAKIDGLQKILPNKNIIRNLHQFRFMGNEAAHELDPPKPNELALAIGIIQDLLNFVYELDYKASQLREMRKNRMSKPKARKTGVPLSSLLLPPAMKS